MLQAIGDGLTSLMGAADDSASERLFQKFAVDQTKKYGEGGYGATYAAAAVSPAQPGEPLAVKIIDTRRMRIEAVRKECAILERLNHPNVIKLVGHGTGLSSKGQQHLYFIFMECASGGELFDQVIDRGANAMPEEVARGFMRELLAGVSHCHERGVAHRDLKLENVLLTREGRVKVIDFGLSHVYPLDANGGFDRSTPLTDMCGSKSYAAPEVLSGRGYDGFAADVWSLGVSLFAMLSGFFPLGVRPIQHTRPPTLPPTHFHPPAPTAAHTLASSPLRPAPVDPLPSDEATSKDWRYTKLAEGQKKGRSATALVYSWYKRKCEHLSPAVVELLDAMLTIDPARRATLPQVLKHVWVVGQEEAKRMSAVLPGSFELLLDAKGLVDANQCTYNINSLLADDAEGPVWRSAMITGPGVQDIMDYDEDDEDSMPVYRSLGLSPDEALPMPMLGRQRAMSRLQ